MAFNEELANRIRKLLVHRKGITEKKMNKNKVAIEPHKINLIKQKTTDDKLKTTKSNLPGAILVKDSFAN